MKILIHSLMVAVLLSGIANAQTALEVTVTNNAPEGGTHFTPVWFGFHDGSFDSYDGGTASSFELERLAEDGNSTFLADTFAVGGTLIGGGSQNGADRVQGSLGSGPIAPGQSASQTVIVNGDGANQFFSYASMILPSSDYYIANGNPFAFDVSDIIANGGEISFDVFQVNDAGTEVNDFATSAGNALLATLDLGAGQNGPDQGVSENGVNNNVLAAYAGFLNTPVDADIDPNFANLKFTDRGIYNRGVASFTIRAVSIPEPSCFTALSALGMCVLRRRRNA